MAFLPGDLPYDQKGTWHGLLLYRCMYCPYTTTVERDMRKHCVKNHLPKPVISPILVADKYGNEVEPDEDESTESESEE